MTTLRDELVQRLEAENDELRARVHVLEEMVGMRLHVPLVFGLTAQEAALFGLLLKREIVTREAAMVVLYGARAGGEGDVQVKIVDVFLCKIRKKLKPFGIAIETVWGRGFAMPPAAKAIANDILDQARAA